MNDMISRQMAIEAINEDKIDLTNPNVVAVFKATGDFEKVETQVMTCDRHIEILKDLPSERKHGKWIDNCTCSICHWIHEDDNGFALITKYNYCPNCGARMEVGDESN